MKLVFIKCTKCGKQFYCETLLTDNRFPLHCPGCGKYISYKEYQSQLQPISSTSVLTRIQKPISKETVGEILYIPSKE